jgi:hypothetical protein
MVRANHTPTPECNSLRCSVPCYRKPFDSISYGGGISGPPIEFQLNNHVRCCGFFCQRSFSLGSAGTAFNTHRDRRTASTPAMAAAVAKNIANRSASYAHANPRLNKETNAIMVSSRTLASNPCPPFCPRRTIPSNKIDGGRGEHACSDGTGRRICLARTMIWLHPHRF